ncbi:hypothetical protein HDU93_002950 [Gonapodya sp. JEL0774]|nr:hypothetical protein HDU93_002950 [Gonapodya sp. JEL0774]
MATLVGRVARVVQSFCSEMVEKMLDSRTHHPSFFRLLQLWRPTSQHLFDALHHQFSLKICDSKPEAAGTVLIWAAVACGAERGGPMKDFGSWIKIFFEKTLLPSLLAIGDHTIAVGRSLEEANREEEIRTNLAVELRRRGMLGSLWAEFEKSRDSRQKQIQLFVAPEGKQSVENEYNLTQDLANKTKAVSEIMSQFAQFVTFATPHRSKFSSTISDRSLALKSDLSKIVNRLEAVLVSDTEEYGDGELLYNASKNCLVVAGSVTKTSSAIVDAVLEGLFAIISEQVDGNSFREGMGAIAVSVLEVCGRNSSLVAVLAARLCDMLFGSIGALERANSLGLVIASLATVVPLITTDHAYESPKVLCIDAMFGPLLHGTLNCDQQTWSCIVQTACFAVSAIRSMKYTVESRVKAVGSVQVPVGTDQQQILRDRAEFSNNFLDFRINETINFISNRVWKLKEYLGLTGLFGQHRSSPIAKSRNLVTWLKWEKTIRDDWDWLERLDRQNEEPHIMASVVFRAFFVHVSRSQTWEPRLSLFLGAWDRMLNTAPEDKKSWVLRSMRFLFLLFLRALTDMKSIDNSRSSITTLLFSKMQQGFEYTTMNREELLEKAALGLCVINPAVLEITFTGHALASEHVPGLGFFRLVCQYPDQILRSLGSLKTTAEGTMIWMLIGTSQALVQRSGVKDGWVVHTRLTSWIAVLAQITGAVLQALSTGFVNELASTDQNDWNELVKAMVLPTEQFLSDTVERPTRITLGRAYKRLEHSVHGTVVEVTQDKIAKLRSELNRLANINQFQSHEQLQTYD